VILTLCSCSASVPEPLIAFSGTFEGNTEDHRPIKLTFTESERGFNGYGILDGNPISLSLLTSFRGFGVTTYKERTMPITAELSFDGNILTITGLDRPAELYREGLPVTTLSGSFTGQFRCGGMNDFVGVIDLVQNGTLVVGTGRIYSQTIALSGIIEDGKHFKGRAIFTDGSQAAITATLSEGDRILTVNGFGKPLAFRR
jgi:hypothetical protein